MPISTRKKARICYKEHDDPSDDELMEEEEEFLQEQEDARKPSASLNKKRKTASTTTTTTKKKHAPATPPKQPYKPKNLVKPPFEILPPEVLEQIMGYLDSARDVFSLTLGCRSRHIRSALTCELVVRSALFQDNGIANQRIQSLIQRVACYSIHMPSTYRMLRLVNGTKCERGVECCSYNKKTGAVGDASSNTSLELGLLLCSTCSQVLTVDHCYGSISLKKNRRVYQLSNRPVTGDNSFARLFAVGGHKIQREAVTGELIGPLITAQKYHQWKATYGADGSVRMHGEVSTDYQTQRDLLQDYLATALEDLELLQARKRTLAHEQWLRRMQEREARRQAKADRKLESQLKIIERLSTALEDCDCPHRDAILNHTVQHGMVQLQGPSIIHLGRFMDAPSYVTQKKIDEAVAKCVQNYELLGQFGFLEGEGYMESPNAQPSSSSHVERALYEFCRHKLTDGRRFWKPGHYFRRSIPCHDNIVNYLGRAMPLEFLVSMLSETELLMALKEHVCHQHMGNNSSNTDKTATRCIVEALWYRKHSHLCSIAEDASIKVPLLKAFWKDILQARRNYHDYLKLPQVIAWRDEDADDTNGGDNNNNPNRPFRLIRTMTKRKALGMFSINYSRADRQENNDHRHPVLLLLRRNFAELLEHQKGTYRSGG